MAIADGRSRSGSPSKPWCSRIETQKDPSARFVSALGHRDVLRARVHVTETALEAAVLINGCAATGIVHKIDRLGA
jgi:hypothetical protein